MALVRPFGRVGVAQLFRVRVLDRPDPLQVSKTPVFAASRALSPVKLLEEVARARAASVIVIMPRHLSLDFVAEQVNSAVSAPSPLSLQAAQLGIADPRASTGGSLVGIRHDLLQHVLAGRVAFTTPLLPQESSEEPALPLAEGAPRPSHDVSDPGAVHLALQSGALLAAASAGDAGQLLRILRGALSSVGTIRAGASGATLLHLFASATAAASTVGLGVRAISSTLQLSNARLGKADAFSTAAAAAPMSCYPSMPTGSVIVAPSPLSRTSAEAVVAPPSALISVIEELVAAGIDVNAPAANGSTALHWAAGAGNVDMVRALLACGADPYARSFTWK